MTYGNMIGVTKGDAWSVDCSSYGVYTRLRVSLRGIPGLFRGYIAVLWGPTLGLCRGSTGVIKGFCKDCDWIKVSFVGREVGFWGLGLAVEDSEFRVLNPKP